MTRILAPIAALALIAPGVALAGTTAAPVKHVKHMKHAKVAKPAKTAKVETTTKMAANTKAK